jgi:hypothetical protein
MKAFIVFGSDNEHPFSFLLNRKRRHVWCIMADNDAGMWVSYNWHQGVPQVRVEAALDFDIASYYRQDGWDVIPYEYEPEAVATPYVLNNCVGHVKSVLGIGGWSLVPNQLYKYITKARLFPMSLFTVPGFGGQRAAAAPTHYSDGTPINATPVTPEKTETKTAKADDKTAVKTTTKTTGTGLGDLGGNEGDNENLTLLRKKAST